jgi:DNA modification methylase
VAAVLEHAAAAPVVLENCTLHQGDCFTVLRGLADASVDAIVTDPPYGLEFMGKDWDAPWKSGDVRQPGDANYTGSASRHSQFVRYGMSAGYGGDVAVKMRGFQDWCEGWARECLRVLKPGGHLLAFSGSRTYHRLASAIEDAGFELRDQIMWVYGSGFPKSHNGEWGGTALKPAHEPICLARKPLAGTVEANWRAHGTGSLNIDACRVEVTDDSYARNCSGDRGHDGTRSASQEGATNLHAGGGSAAAGRWPANFIHDGSAEVLALFPAQAGAASRVKGDEPSAASEGAITGERARVPGAFHQDAGSAARFFYCAKASRADRNEGCEAMAKRPLNWSSGTQNPGSFQSEGTDKSAHNHHPTVKPTELMRYLCRLVTPAGGVVLDPFMGSGSTGKAARLEGFAFVGIEREADFFAIACARIAAAATQSDLFST